MSISTKRALASSLKSLMEKKTLDKITVKDIVDDCSLNRQTFYYHFHDTYELLEWLYVDETKDIMDRVYDPSAELGKYNLILEYVLKNKAFIINTCRSIGQARLICKLKQWVKPVILEIVVSHIGESADAEFLADIYSHSLIGFIFDWVSEDLSEEYLSRFDIYARLFLEHLEALSDKQK